MSPTAAVAAAGPPTRPPRAAAAADAGPADSATAAAGPATAAAGTRPAAWPAGSGCPPPVCRPLPVSLRASAVICRPFIVMIPSGFLASSTAPAPNSSVGTWPREVGRYVVNSWGISVKQSPAASAALFDRRPFVMTTANQVRPMMASNDCGSATPL